MTNTKRSARTLDSETHIFDTSFLLPNTPHSICRNWYDRQYWYHQPQTVGQQRKLIKHVAERVMMEGSQNNQHLGTSTVRNQFNKGLWTQLFFFFKFIVLIYLLWNSQPNCYPWSSNSFTYSWQFFISLMNTPHICTVSNVTL